MNARNKAAEYEKKAKALFDDWKSKEPAYGIDHRSNIFIRDGIADPEQWFSQNVRPLFLLKEAYTKDVTYKKDWDLSDHFMGRSENGPEKCDSTWRRMTQWAYGILNTSTEEAPSFEEAAEAIQSDSKKVFYGNEWLGKIAVVNIKKSSGKQMSNRDDLKAYAKYDAKELVKQIEIIDPTVIICGNTLKYPRTALAKKGRSEIPTTIPKPRSLEGYAYALELLGHPVIVLDYWHPANHFPDIMNYYGLMGVYQQALKNLDVCS